MRYNYTHPHPDPRHIMVHYRKFLLGVKRVKGSARGLIHYKRILYEYAAAKELVINAPQI